MRHVQHLITGYVHGQLRPAQRARVINHVRVCLRCREVLAREERAAADIRREMPFIGQPQAEQLARMWAGVWQDVSHTPRRSSLPRMPFVPGVSAVLVMLVVVLVALPLLTHVGPRAEAAPPRANNHYISPTPGSSTADATERASEVELPLPQATVAFAMEAGASPVPVPGTLASPVAPGEYR